MRRVLYLALARPRSLLPEGPSRGNYRARHLGRWLFIISIGETKMQNAWRTQWVEEHKTKTKRFENEKPTRAVEFGKQLKSRGIMVVDVISMRRAFPPPLKHSISPKPGLLWCPYCLKWREFIEAEVKYPDFMTPILLRCPICRISVKDAYVRMYNPEIVIQYEMRAEMKSRQKEAAKLKRRNNIKGGLRVRR
jgi:hypothetical protein